MDRQLARFGAAKNLSDVVTHTEDLLSRANPPPRSIQSRHRRSIFSVLQHQRLLLDDVVMYGRALRAAEGLKDALDLR